MSLATQLARGTLALPMLLAFAGLGLFANERVEAEPVSAPQAQAQAFEQLQQFRQAEQAAALARLGAAQARAAAALPALGQQLSTLCSARNTRSHVLVLAQAPGDLGTLALRFNTACRG